MNVTTGAWIESRKCVQVSPEWLNTPSVAAGLKALGGDWTYSPEACMWERRVESREEYERLCEAWGRMGFSAEVVR